MRQRRLRRAIPWATAAALALSFLATPLSGPQPNTVSAQATTRTFSGTFAGSGTFSNSLCAWRTTYSGSVTATLTFNNSSVSGTARHQGSYQDVLTSGPSECGGDLSRFDETVTVSGSAQSLRWGFGHGESGTVVATGSLVGNAIVGRGVVTDPDYTGSASIPFTLNEVGSPPPPAANESAPAPSVSAPPAPSAPAAPPATSAPAAPRASATTTSPALSGQPAQPSSSSGTAAAAAPTVVPISPVPAVPPPRDVDPTPRITREMCQDFSSDPALWQALEDHLSELDELEVPIGTAKSCITLYRAQPWAQRPGGATLVKPAEEGAKKDDAGEAKREEPPKATLETEKAVLLRAGERTQPTLIRGARLGAGDALVTRDEPATVGFSEGSRMELGPKSAVVMGDPAEKAVVQLRGRLFMDIKSRQWTVRIPQPRGLVSVVTRGTKFSTEVLADGNVRIEVTESAVEVTSGGKMVVVSAGTSIVVDPSAAPPQPPQPPEAATVAPDGTSPLVFGAATAVALALAGGLAVMMRRRSRSAR